MVWWRVAVSAVFLVCMGAPLAVAQVNQMDGSDYVIRTGTAPENLTERLRLTQSGNLGVGVSPTTRLEVAGTVSATLFHLALASVSNSCASIGSGTTCTASCPAGKKVISGGCVTSGLAALTGNRPVADLSGWACNHGAVLSTLQVTAVCANIQ